MITLTTDFGPGPYVASMKGVILRIHPPAQIVDISHQIRHGDVRHGAFVLANVVGYFPRAVHVAVVDPGVGAGRRGLAVSCKNGTLVGPDNGLLLPAARRLELRSVHELRNPDYWLSQVSNTFHGRDVFAPVAAHLERGVEMGKLGPAIENYVDLDFSGARALENGLAGDILLQDSFGNLVTNIPQEMADATLSLGGRFRIVVADSAHEVSFVPSYGFVKAGELLLLVGSSGYLEVAVNQGSAAQTLSASAGDPVRVEKL